MVSPEAIEGAQGRPGGLAARSNKFALDQAVRGGAALVVARPEELLDLSYAEQGDATLYSEEQMAARRANRTDHDFVAAVQRWWRWLPKSDRGPAGGAAPAGPEQRASGDGERGADEGGAALAPSGEAAEGSLRPAVLERAVYCAMVVALTGVRAGADRRGVGEAGGRCRVVWRAGGWVPSTRAARACSLGHQVLLPRFGLDCDPDYDPSEDWLEDS